MVIILLAFAPNSTFNKFYLSTAPLWLLVLALCDPWEILKYFPNFVTKWSCCGSGAKLSFQTNCEFEWTKCVIMGTWVGVTIVTPALGWHQGVPMSTSGHRTRQQCLNMQTGIKDNQGVLQGSSPAPASTRRRVMLGTVAKENSN